jgi:hypothetical protein
VSKSVTIPGPWVSAYQFVVGPILQVVARCEQNTDWRPILPYAVARQRWLREYLSRMPFRTFNTPESNVV